MFFPIKNRQELKEIEELASLKTQVDKVRLQDRLGDYNYHYNVKKLREPLIDTIKILSETLRKAISETSTKNNETLEK